MSSLRVLQEGHIHHSFQRFTLKESLLRVELSRLGLCLSNARAISTAIKTLHSTFRQRSVGERESQQSSSNTLLQPVSKLAAETHRLLSLDNLSFRGESENQQADKKTQQEFFMQALRTYEGKIAEMSRKIKNMESTIQEYSNQGESEGDEEQFDESLSSYGFLEHFLTLQKQKEATIRTCMQSASKNTINSQIQCNSREKIQEPENLLQSILLKQKIVNQQLKKKLAVVRKGQAEEKVTFDRLTRATREANSRITSLHLEASINSDNNFLLEAGHYSRHWKTMKDSLANRPSYAPSPIGRGSLGRSKSCTVMQSSKLNEEDSDLFSKSSVSIDNEQSLLDNLEYFISENFIKDLADHHIE